MYLANNEIAIHTMNIKFYTIEMKLYLIFLLVPTVIPAHEDNASLVTIQTSENFEHDPVISTKGSAAVASYNATFEGNEFETSRNTDQDEAEYRVFYGGVVGMETVSELTGIFYREATNGERVVKLVYAGSERLVDCEVERDTDAFVEFLARFLIMDVNDVRRLVHGHDPIDLNNLAESTRVFEGNVLYELLGNRGPREPFLTLVDINTLEEQCIDLYNSIKQKLISHVADHEAFQATRDSVQDATHKTRRDLTDIISPTVQLAKDSTPLAEIQRNKRQLGFGLYPGTKWCGLGSSASHYDDLGVDRDTDMCCREHDNCDISISAFTAKYGYFNAYFHTLSHCDCDNTFRSCMKSVDSTSSLAIGKIYFDILGIRCFVLEREQKCVEWNWWGGCTRHEVGGVAKLQSHVRF